MSTRIQMTRSGIAALDARSAARPTGRTPGCSTAGRGSPSARRAGRSAATSSARRSSRCRCAGTRSSGRSRRCVSPSSSSTSRSTPCVLGCCGPMLTVIVSVRISGIVDHVAREAASVLAHRGRGSARACAAALLPLLRGCSPRTPPPRAAAATTTRCPCESAPDSPCAADALPSRRASESGAGPDGRRTRSRTGRTPRARASPAAGNTRHDARHARIVAGHAHFHAQPARPAPAAPVRVRLAQARQVVDDLVPRRRPAGSRRPSRRRATRTAARDRRAAPGSTSSRCSRSTKIVGMSTRRRVVDRGVGHGLAQNVDERRTRPWPPRAHALIRC